MNSSSNKLKILLTGASPDGLNRNSIMRNYVAEGFRNIVGNHNLINTSLDIAAQAVKQNKPDITVCFGSCMPDDSDFLSLRDICSKVGSHLAFWLHDDPYEFDFGYRAIEVADFIFSNDKWSSTHYDHPKVFHLPLAASKSVHYRPVSTAKDIDIFFCGVAFKNRIALIRDLESTLRKYKTLILGAEWPTDIQYASNCRLNNKELADHYSRSAITLNMGRHFDYANDRFQLSASTPGPRTFEAAMAGTVQMYFVESLEIEEYYLPDKEIILFDSQLDLEKHVSMILEDSALAFNIATSAQLRTINEHTYEARARRMINIVLGASENSQPDENTTYDKVENY